MVVALFFGPIVAVQLTEYLRKSEDAKKRKVHIFRTLMATRSANLIYAHIEALNLVEIEFHSSLAQERKVVDCWRLYLAHLNDHNYVKQSADAWAKRKNDLLIDLLYEMSIALGYSYDKSQIQNGAYYPQGYSNAENENAETRKLWLEVLRGQRQFPMKAEVYTNQPPPTQKPPEKGN